MNFHLWPDVSRHLQLPHAVAPMGGGWKWARLSISQTRDYYQGLETHACHVYTIIWGCLSRRLDWPNGANIEAFGTHCLCLENIVQAVRILKQLESNFLPTPATQIEPSMATGWREIRIKGIQVKNMNFVCKRKFFFRERSLFLLVLHNSNFGSGFASK